jgi:Protein of unknown function (DUF2950)
MIVRAALKKVTAACAGASLAIAVSCAATPEPSETSHRTFSTPEEAVKVLTETVKAGKMEELLALFGPDGKELVASSDPATGRRNRDVFTVAVREGWRLVDQGTDTKVLVVGNEQWPFPIPIVRDTNGWRFDTAAGKEEILARRIGRNELAVIDVCRTYVQAQQLYARTGHDGKPAGLYATRFSSDSGKQNGLYWPAKRGEKRSPLGDLVASAAEEGRTLGGEGQPAPFHGYYFKILAAQGAAAPGGAKSYLAGGDMSGGFALVAWPAHYDATGVMTFIVDRSGVVRQKDLGPGTDAAARAMKVYDPDASWTAVE